MRLVEIFAKDVKPIQLFHVDAISETVVLAGPNGVGKTRLIARLLQHIQQLSPNPNIAVKVRATNPQEEREWKKNELDTRDVADTKLLARTLQKNRRRGSFSSSFLNFESNRTIQKVQTYAWDWNFLDPFEEEIDWKFGMSSMTTSSRMFFTQSSEKSGADEKPLPYTMNTWLKAARRL